ncbi:hypothetical protein [Microbacterium sp. NPDC055521]
MSALVRLLSPGAQPGMIGAVAQFFLPYTRRVEAELSAFSRERRGVRMVLTEPETRTRAPRE